VKSVAVLPQNPILQRIGDRQQFAIVATYTDGRTRDVTAEAFVDSSNTEVATVDKTGLMTSVRRGEATMLARYEGAYAASTVVVLGDRSGFTWEARPVHNAIDELVDAKLKKVKVQPSPVCGDDEFVRRVYLDLTGLPPSPETVKAFLDDKRETKAKRDELIDKLVGSEAFVEHWTNKWADLLQVNRKFLGDKGATAFRKWIRDAVENNTPYDKFAYEVLTASGSNVENPPAAYFKVLRTPDAVMENTTQLFLAIRFNCNKCHDHPFERWTQDNYYNLAAYFAQVKLTEDPKFKGQKLGGTAVEGAKPLVELVMDSKAGDVKHERTGEVAPPKFPFTVKADIPSADSRRVQGDSRLRLHSCPPLHSCAPLRDSVEARPKVAQQVRDPVLQVERLGGAAVQLRQALELAQRRPVPGQLPVPRQQRRDFLPQVGQQSLGFLHGEVALGHDPPQ